MNFKYLVCNVWVAEMIFLNTIALLFIIVYNTESFVFYLHTTRIIITSPTLHNTQHTAHTVSAKIAYPTTLQ